MFLPQRTIWILLQTDWIQGDTVEPTKFRPARVDVKLRDWALRHANLMSKALMAAVVPNFRLKVLKWDSETAHESPSLFQDVEALTAVGILHTLALYG